LIFENGFEKIKKSKINKVKEDLMKKELTKDQSFKIEEFLKRIKLVENQIDLTSFRQRVDSQSVIKDYVNDISDYGSIKNQLD
jgi:hypothetical protein